MRIGDCNVPLNPPHAGMAKLVDALDLGSSGATHRSSSLLTRTRNFPNKKRPDVWGRRHETVQGCKLAIVADWTVYKHPYQPYQCRDTNYRIDNITGQCGGAKQKRNQVKTKDTNQTPVQGTDKCQWH